MDRRLLLLAAAFVAALAPGAIPGARADRLRGNYRGPGDRYQVREDPLAPADSPAEPDPLLASLRLDRPFVSGIEAGRREAEFRGRPLLVFLVLPGCDLCVSVAERALRDAEVLDLAGRFVPVAADAEKEEAFGVAHGVRTFPTILLFDAAGREIGRVEGAVDAPRAAAALREGLKKAGAPRPSPEARSLEKAAAHLSRARDAKDWRSLLAHVAIIERKRHDGAETEEARAARGEAAREAASRLDAARRCMEDGERARARRSLERIAHDFAGLRESVEATDLLYALGGSMQAGAGAAGRLRAGPGSDPRAGDVPASLTEAQPVPDPDGTLPFNPVSPEKPPPEPDP
jgi:thioredoxin-like negative regulator of GroEL